MAAGERRKEGEKGGNEWGDLSPDSLFWCGDNDVQTIMWELITMIISRTYNDCDGDINEYICDDHEHYIATRDDHV